MHLKLNTKKMRYTVLGFTAAVLTILGILFFFGKVPVAEPTPLLGIVLEDTSTILLGNDYNICVVANSCNEEDLLLHSSFHIRNGYDAVIMQSNDETCISAVQKVLTNYPVAHLLVPQDVDKTVLQELQQQNQQVHIRKLSTYREIVLGDIILDVEQSQSDLAFVLWHGENSICFLANTKHSNQDISMAIVPSSVTELNLSADSIIYQNEQQVSLLPVESVCKQTGQIPIEFYSDGYGKLLMND